jgi:NAD(P)-dependent dehydrogenase (short-subunit alcohol dehydrogenase family)
MKLEQRIAIVTGAAGGMGGGITRRFVQEGAFVVCVDKVDSHERVHELNALRPNSASGAIVDVRDLDALGALVEEVVERHGRLDVMVNNAGIEQPQIQVIDTGEDVYREVMDTNLWGVIAGTRAAGRVMKAQQAGTIINTASQLGKVAFETWGVYSASKAGVIAITQAAARELAREGVRVNAVCPGTFYTPLAERAFTLSAASEGISLDEAYANYGRDRIGLGRLGDPDEMGALCTFLASDDASFITGAAINLTGGEQYFF